MEYLTNLKYYTLGIPKLSDLMKANTPTDPKPLSEDEYDLIIIGAGMAGLASAHMLTHNYISIADKKNKNKNKNNKNDNNNSSPPLKIIVLEGNDRIGGRLHTTYFPRVPQSNSSSSSNDNNDENNDNEKNNNNDNNNNNNNNNSPGTVGVDLGGSWIHGSMGNPLYEMVELLNVPIVKRGAGYFRYNSINSSDH